MVVAFLMSFKQTKDIILHKVSYLSSFIFVINLVHLIGEIITIRYSVQFKIRFYLVNSIIFFINLVYFICEIIKIKYSVEFKIRFYLVKILPD